MQALPPTPPPPPRKKHWSASWTVLEGGVLTFFKDSKSSTAVGLVRPGPPRQGSPRLLLTPAFTKPETAQHGRPGSWAFGRG